MEVTVLQADIELMADGVIDLGKQLPSQLAAAIAELVNPSIANASADAATDPGFTAEIEPAIEHRLPDVSRLIDIEIFIAGEGDKPATLMASMKALLKCDPLFTLPCL